MSKLADRAVDALSSRLGRRGFLGKAAVVGSAVVAAPMDFALRPGTAYAAVCRGLCSTGYTEFCCTLSGVNACPPGTINGGWWKVDGSHFCGGGPRYYLDCNAQCGTCGCGTNGICAGSCSGTGCGCAKGDCNNWKAGCNKFRYGNCNQDIPCLGPIVCRVVTCTAPWLFDPACGTTSRTDENTRFHTRACAEESFGAVDSVTDIAGAVRVTGWAFTQNDFHTTAVIRVYLDGVVVAETEANQTRSDVGAMFPAFGPNHGFSLDIEVGPGHHNVCIYSIDRLTGRGTFLNFREFDIAGSVGTLELATHGADGLLHVVGWAFDASQRNVSPTVRLVVNDLVVYEGTASVSRPDVGYGSGVSSARGFDVVLPVPLGSPRVCLDLFDRSGTLRALACRDIVAG